MDEEACTRPQVLFSVLPPPPKKEKCNAQTER
jgi:hypothetical protein